MQKKRDSYQSGSVVRKPRKKGPDVWVLRYMDGVQKAEILGTVDKFPTKAAAKKEASKRLTEINERLAGITIAGLCDRFKRDYNDPRPHTLGTYSSFGKRIKAEWGEHRIDDFVKNLIGIENWVNEYMRQATPDRVIPDRMAKGKLIPGYTIPGKPPRPASKKTKLHVKAFLHLLLEFAMKSNLFPVQRNPMTLIVVKGRKKRVREISILTGEQWVKLITDPDMEPHVRVMVYIAMLLGMRVSEILGLRWENIDFDSRELMVRISSDGKHQNVTKTEDSDADLPVHDMLFEILEAWHKEHDEPDEGWLFMNPVKKRPYHGSSMQKGHLIPAGRKIGIASLGWHDFRHTYRAMMGAEKITLEEQRALMRHSDIRTTLSYGGKTAVDVIRPANARVVEMLRKPA